MNTVVRPFADAQDGGHTYAIGDTFPREGFEPTEARIAALVSGKKGKLNKTGEVYLEPVLPSEPEPEQ